jgi:hypothetical protein
VKSYALSMSGSSADAVSLFSSYVFSLWSILAKLSSVL